MSVSKLSAISEERSGCVSGSLMNPSNNAELMKSVQPSVGDIVDDLFMLASHAGTENNVLVETGVLADKPTGKCF